MKSKMTHIFCIIMTPIKNNFKQITTKNLIL